MNFVRPYTMFLLIVFYFISCGTGHKVVVKTEQQPAIVMTSVPVIPIQPDTIKQKPLLTPVEAEKITQAVTNIPKECRDTVIRKLSNAYIDLVYWSHDRNTRKDSQINDLSAKLDSYGLRIDGLTQALIHKEKEKIVEHQQNIVIDNAWKFLLMFIGIIGLIFSAWSVKEIKKIQTQTQTT